MLLTLAIACILSTPSGVCSETIGHVTRDYFGDIFTLGDCAPGSCDSGGRRAAQIPGQRCQCQCAPSHYTFREDVRQCIKDVFECPVAMFVRPFAVERIPLVFLPMTGQLVYPGAHLTVSGISRTAPSRQMACNVKTSLLMTSHGWQPIRTPSHVFGVYYDGNKTFLQWLGDDEDRRRLQHHLVLIRLMCDSTNGTFEPCAALRIGWAPGLEPQVAESVSNKNNYIIVGLCLGILGLIYVGAVLIYLKVRKTRRRGSRQGLSASDGTIEASDAGERTNSQIRSAYINNLVQEAELTTHKSSSKASSKTEAGANSSDNQQTTEIKESTSSGGNHATNSSHSSFDKQLQIPPVPPEDLSNQTASQEFFVRIRGMISAAKNRLNSFRYRPTLLVIPEDDYFYQDFKERDIEMNGERKPAAGLSRKGAAAALGTKLESIHGSRLGAAMLEAKLAPPLPPPRQTKPKSKKRAPSPPGDKGQVSDRQGPSSHSTKPSSKDESADYGGPSTSSDAYSKFDLFRLDLYEKINRMRESVRESYAASCAENDIEVLEIVDNRRLSVSPSGKTEGNHHPQQQIDTLNALKRKDDDQVSSAGKISRRELLHKLEEEEETSAFCAGGNDSVDIYKKHGQPRSARGQTSDKTKRETSCVWESARAGSTTEDSSKSEEPSLKTSSRLRQSSSTHSVRTAESHDSSKNKKELAKSMNCRKHHHAEECSDGSEATEASLSGDSLNSSFRKPSKSPSSVKSKTSHVSMEEMSVLSASSMITASTAIKEVDDYDFEGDEEDDLSEITQDDDSRMSTDLDPDFSLDESEHPSLEEYLQLSSQVAKKLSERTVPAFSGASERERNVLAKFMKDFKMTIGRLRAAEEAKPKGNRSNSPGADNWTLKKEEKRTKVSRKVSIFKRNPLKSRRNDEPLVSDDQSKSGYYDINVVSETDDTMSCNSSAASSLSGKGGKSKYKNKPPEIIPARGNEKTVISISNESASSPDAREAQISPKFKGASSAVRTAKAVTPPLPPPKPNQLKMRTEGNVKDDEYLNCKSYQNHPSENGAVKVNGATKALVTSKTISKELSEVASRFLRSPSIESDSISIANSDMTEDSLNTPIPKDVSDDENQDEISEDENGAIDRCLAQLADSVIQPPDDCSLNRYLSQLGTVLATREDCALDKCLSKLASNMNANRATKVFNVSQHLPLGTYEHVCVDRNSDRSTPTSERSSTSRGSRSSQENLRRKTLSKSKHHHHHHHRPGECKLGTNGEGIHVSDHQDFHLGNGHLPAQGVDVDESYTTRILVEKTARKEANTCPRVTSTSEDEDSHASSHGSSTKKQQLSETNSDPSSTDFDKPRKKRPVVRRSKKGLNGTCRQHIQSNRSGKGDRGNMKKTTSPSRSSSTPRSTSSDVTVIQLEGEQISHVKNVESSNSFVTLINVDSSDCSNSAEEK